MKKLSKLISDTERVLLEGTPFKGRPVVPNPVVSYPSLSQFAPKFESGRTQVTDRFSPDFYSPYLFETPPARAHEQMLIVA